MIVELIIFCWSCTSNMFEKCGACWVSPSPQSDLTCFVSDPRPKGADWMATLARIHAKMIQGKQCNSYTPFPQPEPQAVRELQGGNKEVVKAQQSQHTPCVPRDNMQGI